MGDKDCWGWKDAVTRLQPTKLNEVCRRYSQSSVCSSVQESRLWGRHRCRVLELPLLDDVPAVNLKRYVLRVGEIKLCIQVEVYPAPHFEEVCIVVLT